MGRCLRSPGAGVRRLAAKACGTARPCVGQGDATGAMANTQRRPPAARIVLTARGGGFDRDSELRLQLVRRHSKSSAASLVRLSQPSAPRAASTTHRGLASCDNLVRSSALLRSHVKAGSPEPPAHAIARATLMHRERLTRAEARMVAVIGTGVPTLSMARQLVNRFHRMVRARTPEPLRSWIAQAVFSMLAPFGCGPGSRRGAYIPASPSAPCGLTNGRLAALVACGDLVLDPIPEPGIGPLRRAAHATSTGSPPRAGRPRWDPG